MPDPTDPRAVAENVWLGYDPDCPECKGTGQLDSGGTYPWGERIMLACDCDAPPRAVADDPSGIVQQMPEVTPEPLVDLRAEVERLRAQAKGMTALLRAGGDLLAIESEALRNSISIIGDPDRVSDDPEDAPTIEAINEIEDWIASVKATLFPPALSPETDGGQDG